MFTGERNDGTNECKQLGLEFFFPELGFSQLQSEAALYLAGLLGSLNETSWVHFTPSFKTQLRRHLLQEAFPSNCATLSGSHIFQHCAFPHSLGNSIPGFGVPLGEDI